MRTALIIHGHFYQPPRENPANGIVDNQISASPYKNWNEAVYQTCYRPNAHSRYLDSKGKIKWINNNYESISCNFGPTLLNWIISEHPDFLNSLLEADKKSIKELKHSNFIAQCYNHSILPLDSNPIKRIEISWALAEYRKIFGHDSEGFWCSECAIDKDTIDELALAGIKFVILSPWQATAINGVSLKGQSAPCDRPFIIKGNKYSITAFFYDPDLASGISFGHYLKDADSLYSHLKDMRKNRNNPSLISCATDGEIYGHHEAFGDMALSALIKKINDGNDFYLTNYAAYLEKNPAKDVATLFEGTKEHHGSSWSCCHGVERWVSDCGCHTGGPDNWNQKWRTPLRLALQNFEASAREIITSQFVSILGEKADFNKMMIGYGDVVTNSKPIFKYLSDIEIEYNKKLTNQEKQTLANLMDCYKNVLYSFTSCGWFFNDISGIEPKQNITYAVNAAKTLQQYSKKYLKNELMKDLSLAKSNIEAEGTGADIVRRCYEEEPGVISACYFFIKNKHDKHIERFRCYYGVFHLCSMSDTEIYLENSTTGEIFHFAFNAGFDLDNNLKINLKNLYNGYQYSNKIKPCEFESKIDKNEILQNITLSFAREIKAKGIIDSQISMMLNTLDALRAEGVEPDLTEVQNVIYPYLCGKIKTQIDKETKHKLIEKLNFSYDLF